MLPLVMTLISPALQSYIHGLFVGFFDPAAVALRTSRGYETYFSKQLMRWTVLLSDVLSELRASQPRV